MQCTCLLLSASTPNHSPKQAPLTAPLNRLPDRWSGLLCVKRATASLFGFMALSQKGHKELCQQLQQPLPDHMLERIAQLPPYSPALYVATLNAWVKIQTELLTPMLTPPPAPSPTPVQAAVAGMHAGGGQPSSPSTCKLSDEKGTPQARSSTPSTRTKKKKGWGPEPLSTGKTATAVAAATAADAWRAQPPAQGAGGVADVLPSPYAQAQVSPLSQTGEDYQALWRNELKCTDEALKQGDNEAAKAYAHSASQFRQKHELQQQQQQAGTNADLKPRRGGRESDKGGPSAGAEQKARNGETE
eukprot:scaffold16720_cov18-Tisochrysis_lutea.AAC.1